MFKWACLAVAAAAALGLGWMVNDLRRELRRTADNVNAHLPAILEKAQKSTDTLHDSLPDIVEKTKTSTATLAELSEDVRQLKELAGLTSPARDKSLVAYADSVLDFLQSADATVGTRRLVGKGLTEVLPAKEWTVRARKGKVLYLVATCGSREEFVTKLGDKVLGTQWYVQQEGREPVALAEWVRANHPGSKDLAAKP
jgi:hypothetical protein